MAHFRGTNANFTETRESSSSHSSSSKSESSSVTRSGYAAQGGVMDNFGGVRYPTQGQQPPVQYQQQRTQCRTTTAGPATAPGDTHSKGCPSSSSQAQDLLQAEQGEDRGRQAVPCCR